MMALGICSRGNGENYSDDWILVPQPCLLSVVG